MKRTCLALAGALALGACSVPLGVREVPAPEPPGPPEAVLAMAAPGQDLRTVRLRPGDSCYWYDHVGPVETTPLPLRTVDGARICQS